jgi:hypothetical protein
MSTNLLVLGEVAKSELQIFGASQGTSQMGIGWRNELMQSNVEIRITGKNLFRIVGMSLTTP